MPKKVTKGLRKTRKKVQQTKRKAKTDVRKATKKVAEKTNRARSKLGRTKQQRQQRQQELSEAKNEAKKLANELGAERLRRLAERTQDTGAGLSDALAELEGLEVEEARIDGNELEVVRDPDDGGLDVVFENDGTADGVDLNLTDEPDVVDVFDDR